MRDLPKGWEWTTIGDVAATSLGKMLDKKQATGLHPTPYLRNINVRWGTFDLSDVAKMDIRPEELDRVLAQPGDVIACEGGEPGRAAVWRGPGTIALQKALHRVQPTGAIAPSYLAYLLQHLASSRALERLFTGTTIKHLPQEKLRVVPVPLPPRPEQERIVAAIEEHLSRLDAAAEQMTNLLSKLDAVVVSATRGLLGEWSQQSVGELAALVTKGTTPTTLGFDYSPEGVRFVKAESLIGGRISSDRCAAIEEATHVALRRSQLQTADLLITIAGTLGRVAEVVESDLPANTNQAVAIVRLKDPGLTGFLRRWLASAIGQELMLRGARGVGLQNLNLAQIRSLQVPVPTPREIAAFCAAFDTVVGAVERLRVTCRSSMHRSSALRRSILAAAFSGQLVSQDPDDEPASVLLERIRAEREAAAITRKRRVRA